MLIDEFPGEFFNSNNISIFCMQINKINVFFKDKFISQVIGLNNRSNYEVVEKLPDGLRL